MGGKSKQSQRTKNNVRPSSSSRSAELLSGGISLDGGLSALASGKPLPPLFPSLAAANLEQGLTPEFQICIKKLNKKDPITRAKALNELTELINKSDIEDVVAILPSWAHFYKILTADMDRKVRELTQVCHGALVVCVGRRLAPQLKALLPAWLQAQYDDHAPAQAQAQLSLQKTFPDSKLPEVISFCKDEVMVHFMDNLNGNIEAVLSKRIESAEERELLLNRLVSSSLQGLQYFVLHLPPALDAWLWARLLPLLQGKDYWKLAQGPPLVRVAWYGACGRIVERYRDALGPTCGARLLRVLLEGARDRNTQAAAPLWTCLLQVMHHVQDWHTYLDKKELLVKRILDVLESGGWGDARHLSNMLLPLLAHLPQDLITKEFYESFFNAVFAGFEKKNVLNSKSERQTWMTSLAECLRYLSIQQYDFVLEIVSSVHRTWLEKALSMQHDGQTRSNLIKCSATNMASLVKYWLKQSKEENNEKYDQLIRNFWQNVGSTVLTQIEKSSTDPKEIDKLIEGHILLLQTLKATFSQEAKKQHSIKFDDDEQTAPEKSAVVTQQYDASVVERYKHNLQEVVEKVCAQYLESAGVKGVSEAILTPLLTLLVEFDSLSLFSSVARQAGADTVYGLYERMLRAWLSGDSMRCRAVVDIVFLMMKYMSEDEQDAMFNSFQHFPPLVVEWCVWVCVRHPHVQCAAVRRWLRSPVARHCLRALAGRAAAPAPDLPAAALLRACLAAELLLSEASVADVLQAVSGALARDVSAALERRGALAAQLATQLQEHAHLHPQHYSHLVLQLFRINVLVPRGDSRVSVATWCEIRSSWQDGAAALPPAERGCLLLQVAGLLHQQRADNMNDFNVTKIENIVSLCPYLFNQCDNAESPSDVSEIVAFTKQIFDLKDSDTHVVESYALRHECVTSQLNCLYDDDNDVIATVVRDAAKTDVKELSKDDLLQYVNKNLFRAIYLRNMLLHKVNSDDDDEESSDQRTWCDVLLQDEYIQKEFCNILYIYVTINSLHEGYAFWPHYDIIVETKQKLESLLQAVISATPPSLRASTVRSLAALAAARGHLCALALRWYLLQVGEGEGGGGGHTLEDIVSGNGLFHTLQASTKWSSDESAAYKIKYLVMLRSWFTAFGQCGHELLLRDVTRARDLCDLDVIVNAYYTHNHTMLYDKDITDSPWSEVVSNVAVVEFLTSMVTSHGWDTPAHHWDFTTITLCSLLGSVRKSMDNWGSTKVSMLARAVLRLLRAVRQFVAHVPAQAQRRLPRAHVAALCNEWKDIFAPDTTYNLLAFVMHVLDSCSESEMTNPQIEVIGELITCTKEVDWFVLSEAHKRDAVSLVRLAHCVCSALQQPAQLACKYLAYYLLRALAKPLVLGDATKLEEWSASDRVQESEEEESQQRPQFSLDYLHEAFTSLHEIVDAALSTVEVGEGTCELVATSEPHSLAAGWLLLGDAQAELCRLARGDLAHHYVQIYREREYAAQLVSCCLRLLPGGVFAHASDSAGTTPVQHHYDHMFLSVQDYNVHEAASSQLVGALACRGVWVAVCGAGGGGARGWWGAAAARAARLLERTVRAHVAPHAARDQLKHLQSRAHEIDDTEIQIAWSSNEVTCLYTVEERTIELHVWLSPAHPLVPPRLAAPDAHGPGANTQWVALYLAYQNGSLLNALKMWTRAVSARVESSPQCYICYCRLHPATGRLPRVLCYQCKNKFHNICLRKWFSTSNKSNCPLCRSAF